MLNSGTLNSSALNATANTAEDAVLSGGFSSGSSIMASFMLSAVLSATFFTATSVEANQYTAPTLTNGAASDSLLVAYPVISPVLSSGVHRGSAIEAGYTYGLTGGMDSGSSSNAALATYVIMRGGVSSSGSINNNQYTYSLVGGVHQDSNAYGNVAALISGGIEKSTTLDGAIAASLSGGIASTTNTDTSPLRFSLINGRLHSNGSIDAMLYIPITLPFGIHNSGELGGDLFWRPGQYGGIDATNELGAGTRTDCLFQQSGIDTASTIDANFTIAPILSGGVGNESVVAAGSHFNAVLAGGMTASSELDARLLSGMTLYGEGVHTNGSVSAKYHYDCFLTGGFVSFHYLGGEGDISPILSGGFVTASTNGGNIVIHAELEGGVGSFGVFDASLLSEPVLVGSGTFSHSLVQASYRIDAVTSTGVVSDSDVGGNGIIANVLLRDSIGASSNGLVEASLVASTEMDGGVAQTLTVLSANLIVSPVANGGVGTTTTLDAAVRTRVTLQGYELTTDSSASGSLKTAVFLRDGADSTSGFDAMLLADTVLSSGAHRGCLFDAPIRIIPPTILSGGLSNDYRLSDADIASYYGDMLHNTWQLEIASATELLEISTPIGDS